MDVDGLVNLKFCSLKYIPVKFNVVSGSFDCSNNKLTTLENSPKTVRGSFYCGNNQLISLKGAPKTVGDNFFCGLNPVKFTKEQVRAVCDVKKRIFV